MRENLKKSRIKKGYSKTQISLKLAISTKQYSRIEAGTSNGTIPIWEKLKDILGKSIDYLLEQEEKR